MNRCDDLIHIIRVLICSDQPFWPIWPLLVFCCLIFMYVQYILRVEVYKTPRVLQNSNIFTYLID